jgi:hypothetical protein
VPAHRTIDEEPIMRKWMRLSLAVAALAVLWPAAGAGAAPLRQGEPGNTCVMSGEKVASPARVYLGEKVQLRLTLNADCPPASFRAADIVIAMDISLSMVADGKFVSAKNAAVAFVNQTDLTVHRIGVIGFFNTVVETSGLSSDKTALVTAIKGMETKSGTNISAAVDAAQTMLTNTGRPEAHKVMIVITDGSPNQPAPDPKKASTRSAASAKLAGTEIFTIGLGGDADGDLLKQVASDTAHYLFSPSGADLESVYKEISVLVTDSVVRDLTLVDDLAANLKLVDGSMVPAGAVAADVLNWSSPAIPSDGLTWVYQLLPQKVGTYPTNDKAVATYRDADGQTRQFTFNIPTITVLAPVVDKLCDKPNGWTVMVHSFPDSVGVSGSNYPGCNNRFDAGDWTTATRYPVPDLEYELTTVDDGRLLYRGKGVHGAGLVDQRLYIRICDPPPYRLRLVTKDLGGYALCPNSPSERIIALKDFRPRSFQRTEVRFGLVRTQ